MAGRDPAELTAVLRDLLGTSGPHIGLSDRDFADRPAPPSRRGPRRREVVTYRVRVGLKGTRPPLWRRLELASDLFLDQVHDIIQIALGWTDSHLHGFASGPDFHAAETERYLCPFDAAEGETGIPEGKVRLDEVLAKPDDKLLYDYDYDYDYDYGWEHVIALETAQPRASGVPLAACTGGRRSGPAEDCGGVYGYEVIEAAVNADGRDEAGAAADFAAMFGADVDITALAGTPFDIDEINAALTAWSAGGRGAKPDLPVPGLRR